MKPQHYDLIGDIHGQYDKLNALLTRLDYEARGDGFRHPEGRKVVFLGDYIDRGPKVRQVLTTVRGMMEAGDALAIMGNHEYNAVLYHTPDGEGDWLRPRRLDRDSGLRLTLAQFAGLEAEWNQWLEWMRRLPLFLDLDGLRAVHACWDAKGIKALNDESLASDTFLRASADPTTPRHQAVEILLKGPEMAMPNGFLFQDKEGIKRSAVRVRWWNVPEKARVGMVAMPQPFDITGDETPQDLSGVPNYGAEEPPVFFGHYWLPATLARAPLRHNIACLDFSAASDGPLVAYRWNGERHLDAASFITACQ